MNLMDIWQQYKSVIIGLMMISVEVCRIMGWLTPDQASQIMNLLGGGAVVTLAMGKNRIENDVKSVKTDINTMKNECVEGSGESS